MITRTAQLETKYQTAKAEAIANKSRLDGFWQDYTNRIKGGTHPDQLKDITTQITELQTRQAGLDLAAAVALESVNDAKDYDRSDEAKAARKRLDELDKGILTAYGDITESAVFLHKSLADLFGKMGEYDQLHKQLEGVHSNMGLSRKGAYFRALKQDVYKWLDNGKSSEILKAYLRD